MKHLIIITTLCATICGAGILKAEESADPHPRLFAKAVRGYLAEELDLTSQQREGIRGILKAERPVLGPIVTNLMEQRKALRTEIAKGPGNENAIRAQSGKVAALEADFAVHRARVRAKIDNVLTPEQRTKADTLRARIESRVEDFRRGLETHL